MITEETNQNQQKTLSLICQKRVCLQEDHLQKPIQLICLQQNCKNNRLLCISCLCKEHLSHNFTTIQNTKQSKLQLLKMHALDSDITFKRNCLQTKYYSIQKIFDQIIFSIIDSVQSLKKKALFQLLTISKTLDTITYDQYISNLLNPRVYQEYLQQEVNMIHFLQSNQNLKDFDKIYQILNVQEKQIQKLAKKYKKLLQSTFQQFKEQIPAYLWKNQKKSNLKGQNKQHSQCSENQQSDEIYKFKTFNNNFIYKIANVNIQLQNHIEQQITNKYNKVKSFLSLNDFKKIDLPFRYEERQQKIKEMANFWNNLPQSKRKQYQLNFLKYIYKKKIRQTKFIQVSGSAFHQFLRHFKQNKNELIKKNYAQNLSPSQVWKHLKEQEKQLYENQVIEKQLIYAQQFFQYFIKKIEDDQNYIKDIISKNKKKIKLNQNLLSRLQTK